MQSYALFHDPRLKDIAALARRHDPAFAERSERLPHDFRNPALRRMAHIAGKYDLRMDRQQFVGGPYIDPPVANLTTLTATTIEDLWPGITWTPIFANEAKAGRIYCVRAGGTISLTGGTGIITPQWGPAGTTLGVSLTVGTVTAAIAAWWLQFDLCFRVIGAAGANTTCIGTGLMAFNGGVVSGTANPNLIVFGGTSASVDSTINGNVTIRKTLSAANSVIPQFVRGYWAN